MSAEPVDASSRFRRSPVIDETIRSLPTKAVPDEAPRWDPAPWQALRPVAMERRQLLRNRIVTLERSRRAAAPFDTLRTKLLRTARQNGWITIAVTSPTAGCGKSVVALNLAFSLSHQPDCRTVLLDLNLRRPSVAKALGLPASERLDGFLAGRSGLEATFVRFGDNLAIGASRTPVPYPAEILQAPETATALAAMRQTLKPDIVLLDAPPMLATDDLLAILPQVDAVILVAAAEISTMAELDACERDLGVETNVVGIVLNRCRYMRGVLA